MNTEQPAVDVAASERGCSGQLRETHSDGRGELPRLMRLSSEERSQVSACSASIVIARLDQAVAGAAWRFTDSNGIAVLARKAATCVLTPNPGDLVQVLVEGKSAWIVAILEHAAPDAGRVVDFGDADVVVHAGSLEFQGRRRITHQAQELCSSSLLNREVSGEKSMHVRNAFFIHAGSMNVDVDRHLRVHSNLATITSEALLKLDGAQIHVG